jgi:hypothetical protein
MRTAIVILIGLAALAAFALLGPLLPGHVSRTGAAWVFLVAWLIFCVIDWYVGVYRAGYPAMEEFRIHAVIFAVPAVAAFCIMAYGAR